MLDDEMTPSIRALLRTLSDRPRNQPINLGQVVCLGLDGVRSRIGEASWGTAEALVSKLVEKTIRQICSPRDVFVRCRDGAFVIVFATADRGIAVARAAKIADTVNQALFGMDSMDGVTIQTTVRTATGLSAEPARNAAEILRELMAGAERLNIADAAASAIVPRDERAPAPDQTRPMPPAPREGTVPRCRDALMAQFQDFAQAPVSFRYFPVWGVRNGSVFLFHCTPMRESRFGEVPMLDYEVLGDSPATRDIIDLDIATVEHGLLAHCRRLRDGRRQCLSFNLHYETIASNAGRVDLLELLRQAPASVRATLSARLVGVPDGIPEGHLKLLAGQIAPYIQGLSAMIPLDRRRDGLARALRRLRSANLHGALVGYDGQRAEAEAGFWRYFAEGCQELGLTAGVCGVAERETAMRLCYAGLGLLAGPILGGPFETLPEPYPFGAKQLEGRETAMTG